MDGAVFKQRVTYVYSVGSYLLDGLDAIVPGDSWLRGSTSSMWIRVIFDWPEFFFGSYDNGTAILYLPPGQEPRQFDFDLDSKGKAESALNDFYKPSRPVHIQWDSMKAKGTVK